MTIETKIHCDTCHRSQRVRRPDLVDQTVKYPTDWAFITWDGHERRHLCPDCVSRSFTTSATRTRITQEQRNGPDGPLVAAEPESATQEATR